MKMVTLVRADLKMKPGKLAAQAQHSAVGAALLAFTRFKGVYSEWEATGQKKVILKVSSEQELLALYSKAIQQGLPCYLVKDAGKTTFHGTPTLTCCAIGPGDDYQIDPIVGHLKLL
jgi:peptidyl-tRNA hydrolase, PTH2 family